MIRLVHCVRKREDMTLEEFRDYWQSPEFDEKLRQMAQFLGARRYSKNATLAVAANLWIMEQRHSGKPFDGIIEYWWESAGHIMGLTETEEFKALSEGMEDYQRWFLALDQSIAFFAEVEHVDL